MMAVTMMPELRRSVTCMGTLLADKVAGVMVVSVMFMSISVSVFRRCAESFMVDGRRRGFPDDPDSILNVYFKVK